MATAVLDVDLATATDSVEVGDRYERALVLVRWDGEPIGAVRLEVGRGHLSVDDVVVGVLAQAPDRYWQHWWRSQLGATPAVLGDAPSVTVAVCTRDRADDLAHCLDSMSTLPDDGQEVLVVDSCSGDDGTARVASSAPGVRYARVEAPGLDRARNVALREARNEVVAFCDDDARVDANWLRALARNFRDPCVMAVTGLTMPFELETEAQERFEEFSPFGRGFERRVHDLRSIDPLNAGALGAGANMAVRRSALDLVGPFDEALDAGTETRSGGDTDMLRRVVGAGYRAVYEPAALSWHRHRRSWPELVDVEYGYGVGVYASFTAALLDGDTRVPVHVLRGLKEWHAPQLLRSFSRHERALPRDAAVAFSKGSVAGPLAYWRARRSARSSP